MARSKKLKIPAYYSPKVAEAVIAARRIMLESDGAGWEEAEARLMSVESFSPSAVEKCLTNQTFRHAALYPDGHPEGEAIRAEARAKGRRSYRLSKIRADVIERDGGRCQNCDERVWGRNATLDHKDPEGGETMGNIHLLCRRCNTLKGRRSWAEFQEEQAEWRRQLKARQDSRPDFICKQTGLSVRGRSWAEAGCLTPDMCSPMNECDNGEYKKWEAEMDAAIDAMVNYEYTDDDSV